MKVSTWILGLVVVLVLACVNASLSTKIISLTKLLTGNTSGKELKINFKLFLSKMKLRRVPLVKERNERLLAKIYAEKRLIVNSIEEIESNLKMTKNKNPSRDMFVIEISNNRAAEGKSTRPNLEGLKKVTAKRIDQWQSELKKKQEELESIRTRIRETEIIISSPENHVSVPSNYERVDPHEVQEAERKMLLKDRLNSKIRADVSEGEVELPFLSDNW